MNLKAEEKRSPMMAQWYACKEKAKDALLLFRLGDFYEAFYEDAALLSRTVDVTLTQRQGVPMSGVPAHAAEGYIEKLVSEGYLVAIAEQIEDPKMVKGIVKREVVRIVSPGTLLSSLPDKDNNFFASLAIFNKLYALAFLDLSTGELRVMEVSDLKEIKDELFRSSPSELLISEKDYQTLKAPLSELQKSCHFRITERKNWEFNPQAAHGKLTAHFQTHNLDGFGLQGMVGAVIAAGALLSYIGDELHLSTSHIRSITREELSTYLSIDQATERNLELTRPLHGGGKQFTLLKLLDHTSTPMGARLLKSWLTHPLLSVEEIQKRQEGVEELLSKKELGAHLKPVRDVERLMMRVMSKTANPRDLIALKESLRVGEKIQPVVLGLNRPIFQTLSLPDCQKIVKLISSGLTDEPPVKLGEGRVIREGLHKELDELRELKQNGQSWIAKYQAELKEQGRIKN
ncbi:MAG: DNA mismatch repair protein MutS, partial [Chlamydiia bacterium]|nr:DNA mismatch repair protein MutS [Chlamydiia bacterium]